MAYIRTANDPGCVLCHNVNAIEDDERLVVDRTALAFSILNKYPYTDGHLMVCPSRHVGRWADLTGAERTDLVTLVKRAGLAIERTYGRARTIVGANLGRPAGAGVTGHVHLHLVPAALGEGDDANDPDHSPAESSAPLDHVAKTIRAALEAPPDPPEPADRVGPPPAGLDAPPASWREPAITRAAKLCLTRPTPPGWAALAASHLSETLLDHAWCEKKAAATAMALVSRYPEDGELVRRMVPLAHEEWSHFERVHAILNRRAIPFAREQRDPYVNELLAVVRKNEPERFLDRLLVAAFIEARSCERFALLAEALHPTDPELVSFYRELFASEARHYTLFVELAYGRFPREEVRRRLAELSSHESAVIGALPLGPRMH
jgi:tRNA-(ms[2]io[6]A)-hydroxylase